KAGVGAVEPERAVEFVHRFLGGWKNPAQKERLQIPEQAPLKKTKRRVYKVAGKNQSDLVIGTLGPKRRSPDFLPASLGNSILGQFGMMGRIGRVVREKSGLAYYASSSLSTGLGPGSWSVAAGVNPVNVEKVVNLVIAELRRFVKGGVTKQELSDNQDNYVGRLPLSMESNGGVAGALINIERNNLDLDYYRDYERSVRAVKRQEIQEVAGKYIVPERLAIAIAGP
ncbi:MAG: insulinase family protein, partial [Anaerolineaceae bacterium]|nr:insulinase family protein [Anaerolineaceae bacterium]